MKRLVPAYVITRNNKVYSVHIGKEAKKIASDFVSDMNKRVLEATDNRCEKCAKNTDNWEIHTTQIFENGKEVIEVIKEF